MSVSSPGLLLGFVFSWVTWGLWCCPVDLANLGLTHFLESSVSISRSCIYLLGSKVPSKGQSFSGLEFRMGPRGPISGALTPHCMYRSTTKGPSHFFHMIKICLKLAPGLVTHSNQSLANSMRLYESKPLIGWMWITLGGGCFVILTDYSGFG
ncbi:hypothetical protein XELAEV_18011242mg [Xenopus laevis]|uniref:Uncharacterized protein n=1 Tax=Xenopus laevis TaxID=8355 RepID=A0A974DMW2_XENLA|nr:hypothetical protein XELAEV_18011242mg [Xenopus laevis]